MAEKGLNCGINKTKIMATEIIVPDIGDFENVEIIEILAKPGDTIKKNDPVVTLESDKSSVEVPSPFAGKISSLEVKIGDKVSKGSVLAVIESEKVETSTEPIKQKEGKTKPLVLKTEISKKRKCRKTGMSTKNGNAKNRKCQNSEMSKNEMSKADMSNIGNIKNRKCQQKN